jgi:hypothetical protein
MAHRLHFRDAWLIVSASAPEALAAPVPAMDMPVRMPHAGQVLSGCLEAVASTSRIVEFGFLSPADNAA